MSVRSKCAFAVSVAVYRPGVTDVEFCWPSVRLKLALPGIVDVKAKLPSSPSGTVCFSTMTVAFW